jgi:hypothetical protein
MRLEWHLKLNSKVTHFGCQLIPSGPVYALDTDESYKTQLTTAFHAERVAKGNATVSVYVKAVNSSEAFRFVRNDYYSWVRVFTRNYLPMAMKQKEILENIDACLGFRFRV